MLDYSTRECWTIGKLIETLSNYTVLAHEEKENFEQLWGVKIAIENNLGSVIKPVFTDKQNEIIYCLALADALTQKMDVIKFIPGYASEFHRLFEGHKRIIDYSMTLLNKSEDKLVTRKVSLTFTDTVWEKLDKLKTTNDYSWSKLFETIIDFELTNCEG